MKWRIPRQRRGIEREIEEGRKEEIEIQEEGEEEEGERRK